MHTPDPENKLLFDFLLTTNQPIFLTGKAGTGKTTLLKKIKDTTKKNFAIVAPTAVAAINAGGVTLHSFFQIPFGPLIPNPIENENDQLKYSNDKVRLLRCLELLIIDEVSMVRVDIIDFIDSTLKKIKGSNLPFGGVQVLMIGDLFQLSPIFHDSWHILGRYYTSPYFFDSLIFRSVSMLTFTLDQVYRQSDPLFLNILNGMRENNLEPALLDHLNKQYDPTLDFTWKDDYITLTTHNQLVADINMECLAKLDGEVYHFKADISGDFPKDAFPTDENLQLKLGAQVIFIKNDTSGKMLFYNGKAAKITNINKDSIKVMFTGSQLEFEVEKETWQNIKYNLSAEQHTINETSAGSFSQYPFKLAWAITVHKSQGLTFDKAIIDVSSAFTHGQAYVALSRCRNLEGMILRSPIKQENIITDPKIVNFTQASFTGRPDAAALLYYTQKYAWSLIRQLLDFSTIASDWEKLGKSKLLDQDEMQAFLLCYEKANPILQNEIIRVSNKFMVQELSKIPDHCDPNSEQDFMSRLQKASQYFMPKMETVLAEMEKISKLKLYNDRFSDRLFNLVSSLKDLFSIKIALFRIPFSPFSVNEYIETMHAAGNFKPIIQEPIPTKTVIKPKAIANPQLYDKLSHWRKAVADKRGVQEYAVLSDQSLLAIAEKLPRTTDQLAAIKSVGIGNARELGQQITGIVNAHLGTSTLF